MSDNRQVAYVLALVGGIVAIAMALLGVLIASFVGAAFGGFFGLGMWNNAPGGAGLFGGAFALIALLFVLAELAAGIVLLVAAPRLRSDDVQERRTWAIWTLVAGGVALVAGGGNLLAGGLGVAAGIVTMVSDAGEPTRS